MRRLWTLGMLFLVVSCAKLDIDERASAPGEVIGDWCFVSSKDPTTTAVVRIGASKIQVFDFDDLSAPRIVVAITRVKVAKLHENAAMHHVWVNFSDSFGGKPSLLIEFADAGPTLEKGASVATFHWFQFFGDESAEYVRAPIGVCSAMLRGN